MEEKTKSGSETANDSERIRILSPSSPTRNEPKDEVEVITNIPITTSSGSVRRKSLKNSNKEHNNGDGGGPFYNVGFSLSSSDIENSWKKKNQISHSNSLRSSNKSDCKISIHRDVLDSYHIDKNYAAKSTENLYKKTARYAKYYCVCNFDCLVSYIVSLFPIISWLPKYKREYFVPDLLAGFTIAILHIPQGMAYGVLASAKSENGLYVSFFPVLVYVFLGTSRHASMGTFAVISLMLSNAVTKHAGADFSDGTDTLGPPTEIEILSSLAMSVGILMLLMFVFHLGVLTVILSDQLVSGFTTAASIHVAVSQLDALFGFHSKKNGGVMKVVEMMKGIVHKLPESNWCAIIMSVITIFVLSFTKELIDPRVKHKIRIPLPMDLVVVIVGTAVTYLANLVDLYGLQVIGNIPTGLPSPVVPRFDIMPSLLMDTFTICIISYAISLAMAKLLAKKFKYTVNANQELFAMGTANVISSFFLCFPCAASLSRTSVNETAGVKTQASAAVSCIILLIVLLVLSPLFYYLPECILSCIVIVALKPMFVRTKDFLVAWRISRLDACIWLVTFWSTCLLDVQLGLAIGVVFSLLTVLVRSVIPSKAVLGRLLDTDIYLDIERYTDAQEIKGIKIFHFESSLYFINREVFKHHLSKIVPLDSEESDPKADKVHKIILDCSSFSFVDMSGLETLVEIMKDYWHAGIIVFLSSCSISLRNVMEEASFDERIPYQPCMFPTVHDAVEYEWDELQISET